MKFSFATTASLTASLFFVGSASVFAQPMPLKPFDVGKALKSTRGVNVVTPTGTTRIEVWSDRVIRVTHSPLHPQQEAPSLSVVAKPITVDWTMSETGSEIVLKTKFVQARVNKKTGQVRFLDLNGASILNETADGTSFTKTSVGTATDTLAITQRFVLDPNEGIYGLGQHQDGLMNQAGSSVHLQQKNTEVAIPVLLSSKGYMTLWDNPAVTDVDAGKTEKGCLSWKSEAGSAADYYFVAGPEPGLAMASYRWLTGEAPMFGKWAWGYWQSKEHYATQDELVGIVAEYRKRGIPLDGIIQDWHYWADLNQQTAENGWGSHAFDPSRYPDPAAMVKAIHDLNAHVMVVSWGKFDTTNADVSIPNLQKLEAVNGVLKPENGYIYPDKNKYYDPFSDAGRGVYWKEVSAQLASLGVDAWWLDASEPELSSHWGELRNFTTAKGPGPLVFNAYPLEHTRTVYEGQRADFPTKRVMILTRSAYAGQQRNAAVTWSGDIGGGWNILQKQIPAGLNFVASGIPYWNTDIGGFFGGDPKDPGYAELFTRWFQYGAFTPMFRVHGTNFPKEVWRFDEPTQKILTDTIELRYHLLPYIYSSSWRVTHEGYSLMRPLVMDFNSDAKTYNVGNQFMFGPSLLVCPVTKPIAPPGGPVPADHFFDQMGTPGGLTGSYYRGINFEDKVLERKDADINFNWTDPPAAALDHDHYSVRWEGQLLTNQAGTYTFHLGADDGYRLWVNGKLLIEDWASRAYTNKSATIDLPANTRVPVKVEYYQNAFDARVDLTWTPPGSAQSDPFRSVYLPAGTRWTNFWTGDVQNGGQQTEAFAPIEHSPLFVRAGAILPLGPTIQYADQDPSGPIELRVYRGANGVFNLYEDEGDNYNYEKGAYSIIPLRWDDKKKMLSIGERKGSFPGMVRERTFRIVWVSKGHGVGGELTQTPDTEVKYAGKPLVVRVK